MKITIGRVLAVLIALLTISNSLLNIFAPGSQIDSAQLLPQSIGGWSNFRVGMGAPFLTAGLFAAYAAWSLQRTALVPVIVFFCCVVFARLVGFATEGFDQGTMQFTLLAVAVLVAATATYRLFTSGNDVSN